MKKNFFSEKNTTKLAIVSNIIVGFVSYQTTDVIEILRISTDAHFKNKAIVSSLINELKQYKKSIILELRDNNFKVFNLYKKLGFKQITIREKHYLDCEDAKMMCFELRG